MAHVKNNKFDSSNRYSSYDGTTNCNLIMDLLRRYLWNDTMSWLIFHCSTQHKYIFCFNKYKKNVPFFSLQFFQFFTGWWFFIDAISVYSGAIHAVHILLGILGTVSLIMVNSVTQAQVNHIYSLFITWHLLIAQPLHYSNNYFR